MIRRISSQGSPKETLQGSNNKLTFQPVESNTREARSRDFPSSPISSSSFHFNPDQDGRHRVVTESPNAHMLAHYHQKYVNQMNNPSPSKGVLLSPIVFSNETFGEKGALSLKLESMKPMAYQHASSNETSPGRSGLFKNNYSLLDNSPSIFSRINDANLGMMDLKDSNHLHSRYISSSSPTKEAKINDNYLHIDDAFLTSEADFQHNQHKYPLVLDPDQLEQNYVPSSSTRHSLMASHNTQYSLEELQYSPANSSSQPKKEDYHGLTHKQSERSQGSKEATSTNKTKTIPIAKLQKNNTIRRKLRKRISTKDLEDDAPEPPPKRVKRTQTIPSNESLQNPTKKKQCPRSRNGCWTCRVRHKACPEQRPVCQTCARLSLHCDYSDLRPAYMTDGRLLNEKLKEIRAITSKIKRGVRNQEPNKERF